MLSSVAARPEFSLRHYWPLYSPHRLCQWLGFNWDCPRLVCHLFIRVLVSKLLITCLLVCLELLEGRLSQRLNVIMSIWWKNNHKGSNNPTSVSVDISQIKSGWILKSHLARWYRAMILALGARGPELKSQTSPWFEQRQILTILGSLADYILVTLNETRTGSKINTFNGR